jgi:hypothetical protein
MSVVRRSTAAGSGSDGSGEAEKAGDHFMTARHHLQHPGLAEERLTDVKHDLTRGLKARHITMIAIGGAVGTGLIIGTLVFFSIISPHFGKKEKKRKLKNRGNAQWFGTRAGRSRFGVDFVLAGGVPGVPGAVRARGDGGVAAAGVRLHGVRGEVLRSGIGIRVRLHVSLALRDILRAGIDVDECMECFVYRYWFKYIITTPNQLTAGALILQFWVDRDRINPGVWITIFLVTILFINYFGIKLFGEIEFWLSSFKVVTIVGLIILSLVLALGGGPDHDRKGFRYWKNPGAFKEYIDTGATG